MYSTTQLTIGGGFGIVHPVHDGIQCPQIGKDGFQIVVCHVPVEGPGHDRREVTGSHSPRSHDLNKKVFIIVTDTRRIRRNVGSSDLAPRFF